METTRGFGFCLSKKEVSKSRGTIAAVGSSGILFIGKREGDYFHVVSTIYTKGRPWLVAVTSRQPLNAPLRPIDIFLSCSSMNISKLIILSRLSIHDDFIYYQAREIPVSSEQRPQEC